MSYTTQKVFVTMVCSIFIVIGAGLFLSTLLSRSFDVTFVIGSGFLGLGTYNLVTTWRRISKFQTQTYEWYRAQNPSHAHGGGVSCKKCGGTRIHARGLMQHTYTREHFCTQCGTTLYYSPE